MPTEIIHQVSWRLQVLYLLCKTCCNSVNKFVYLEYANPVLWMWFDELCQGVVTLQSCMWQVTLPHILEDDMGKV